MAEFTSELSAEVLAACEAGKEEIAGALGRALDAEFEVSAVEEAEFDADSPPDGFDGAGLAVVIELDEVAAVVVVPEATGLLPDWYASPDATGTSKLTTLAQELGMLTLPESLMASNFLAGSVSSLGESLARGELAESTGCVALRLAVGEKQGSAHLLWPVAKATAIFDAKPEAAEPVAEVNPEPAAETPSESPTAAPVAAVTEAFGEGPEYVNLPPYARSLLQIRVPVTVTLARKKRVVSRILTIAPGAILQFDKACDEVLEMEIGDQAIAEGEAVKVGDRFGIRITQIQLPDERFHPVVPS